MTHLPHLTLSAVRILLTIPAGSPGWAGADLMRATGIPSGTLYPILHRLHDHGWLKVRQERGNPTKLGRPVRHYYTLTNKGQKITNELRHELKGLL